MSYSNNINSLYEYLKKEGLDEEASHLSSLFKSASPYVIKAGDTPYRLSGGDPRYQAAIEEANPGMDWRRLQIGQEIELPEAISYPNANANYSAESAELIKKHEKLYLTAYDDDGWWAVGYGHRYGRLGQAKRVTISENQANIYLKQDMDIALSYLKKNIKVELSQPQIDALVSIVYNVGTGTFHSSRLKATIDSGNLMKAGNDITSAFISSPGHTERRYEESTMFKGGTG